MAGSVCLSWWVMSTPISSVEVRNCLGVLGNPDPNGGSCSASAFASLDTFRRLNTVVTLAVSTLPLLLGMFMAAPFMGRELENGTHRLIWTQAVTPLRWLLVRAACCVGFALGVLALVAVATVPWLTLGSVVWLGSRWPGYDLSYVVFLAYGLFAVALGLAAATVTGRTVVSMAVTAVGWIAIRGVFEIFLRPNLLTPVLAQGASAGSSGANWFLGIAYVDSQGHTLTPDQVTAIVGSGSIQDHGILMAGLIQPAGRFWTFQGAEAAFFIMIAVICLFVSIGWVKYRLASQ
jgi:hypothetical protein